MSSAPQAKNPASLYIVILIALIDLIGFGIVLPLLPHYASRYNASPVAIGLLYSVYSFAQLIFSPFWGALSDRVGRRPILILSTLGNTAAYLVFAFADSFGVIFLSRLLAGMMSGNIAVAQAYVSDVTTEKDRARGMGLIGAAFGVGFVLGPALGALLVSDLRLPGLGAACLSLVSFFLVVTKLPETVSPNQAHPKFEYRGVFGVQFWKNIRQESTLLMFGVLVLALAQASLYSAFPLFCQNVMGYSPRNIGFQYMYLGLIAVLLQGGGIRPLVARFGEERLFFVGSILMMIGFFLVPFARSPFTLIIFLTIMSIGYSLNGPTLNSLVSKAHHASVVGAAMGAAQGMAGLGRMIGPTWGGFLYGFSFDRPFFATALLSSFLVWMGWKIVNKKPV